MHDCNFAKRNRIKDVSLGFFKFSFQKSQFLNILNSKCQVLGIRQI